MRNLLVVLLTIACSSADAALIAHWTFDESSGPTAHDSAGSFHGTLSGGATFVSGGISGNALSLDESTGSLVNMGTSFPGLASGDFSVAAWVKTTTTSPCSTVLAKHNTGIVSGYGLIINESATYGLPGKAYFYQCTGPDGVPISSTTVNDGVWHQIIAVYRAGGDLQLYVDGRLEATKPSHAIGPNSAPLLIGGLNEQGVPTGEFTGLADDVQVYDIALSGSQVQFLFSHPGQVVPDLPILTIDVSEVRLCWNSKANTLYQVQYRSDLTANAWVNLGEPIPGNGTTNCMTDAVVSPRRYYQVVVVP